MVSVVQKKLQKKIAQRQSHLEKLESQKKKIEAKIMRTRVKLGAATRELRNQMRVEEGHALAERLEAWAEKKSDDTGSSSSSSSSSTSALESTAAQAPRRQEVVKDEPPAGAAPDVKPEPMAEAVVPAVAVEAPVVQADSVASEPPAKKGRGRPSIMPPGFTGCKACFWLRRKGNASGQGHKRDAPDHDPTLKAVKQE